MIIIIIQRYVNGELVSRERLKAMNVAPAAAMQITDAVVSARRRVKVKQSSAASKESLAPQANKNRVEG